MTDAAPPPIAARCVICGGALTPRVHETIEVLACASGHGLFLDSDALRTAVRDRTSDRPEEEELAAEQLQGRVSIEQIEANEGTRACPVCGETMGKRVYAEESGVAMDACAEHGIWLDEGELERIEAWYERQERYRAEDTLIWGGDNGRLEQIEREHEREISEQAGALHWGPVGWVVRNVTYGWNRKDDLA